MNSSDPNQPLRVSFYQLLTIITVAIVAARVMNVERLYEPSLYRAAGDTDPKSPPRDWPKNRPRPMPTFSSNDRSRWAMARALVDHGTFEIGRREVTGDQYKDVGIVSEDGWQTLDKVLDPKTKVFYSSKPPLFPVLVAGEYWLLKKLFGWTLTETSWKVVCTVLLTFNVLPLLAYFVMLARLIEKYGQSDWGRMVAFAAGCFCSFLTTFSTSLNNHTLGAIATLASVYPILMSDQELRPSQLAWCGLFAGLAFCFELPCAVLIATIALVLFIRTTRSTLLAFLPAALLPVLIQQSINYKQIGDWKPTYEKMDSEWYRYPGSHWAKQGKDRIGIDFAADKESRWTYAFHLLLGHHGIFSLTPVTVFGIIGMAWTLALPRRDQKNWWDIQLVGLSCTLVCLVFFTAVVSTANYGGWTSGPRWFFWLTPFLVLGTVTVFDRLSTAMWGRIAVFTAIAFSTFSAWFPNSNPWRHPWIYQAMESAGWPGY